jgi:cobalt-zinc-cadmium resistance protein CzcA
MLTRILDWSLHHRLVVILAWVGVAIAGVLAWVRLPIDAFPDTTPVQVQINSVAAALAPLEVERQITRPLETSISGLPGLVEVRSVSKFGFSQITATFADGTDIYLARQVVLGRLQGVEIPPDVKGPTLGPVATGLGEIFHYLVTGTGHSLAELRTIQDWIIAPQLRAVSGVAEVNSWGGDERQVHVMVDPRRLQQYDLSLAELAQALEDNNTNVGGGTLDQAGESSLIQGIGIATRSQDIEDMVVASRAGVPIRVRDVARVVDGREIRRGAVTADGTGEVVLGLAFMLMGENSHDVAQRLALRLDEVRKGLPAGVEATTVYDRTHLVEKVLHTVRTNLLEGSLLVIAVLFLFLGQIRAGLIVAAAIPLSMLFASNLMVRFGIAGSLMSLGAIDFGLIVDSSVIQIENVMRRLGEDRGRRPVMEVVRDAVVEVRKPTLFGELIIAIVYLPILTLEGIEGKLFRPMALTVIFALAGSMLLSLTLIPVLASFGLGRRREHGENAVMRGLVRSYRPVLRFALDRPGLMIAVALIMLANATFLATRLGSEFVPRLREGAIVINTVRLAGVSIDESVRYGTQIERALLASFPDEVERVWTRSGSAEIATDPMGVELSDVFITLRAREQWRLATTQEELVREMADALSSLPGMRMVFTQPIEMRVNEMIAGIRADVGVKLFGNDFDTLKAKADEIAKVLGRVPGAADVFAEQITGQPVLEIAVDRQATGRQGIAVKQVLGAVEALGPRHVGVMQDGEIRVPIALRVEDRYRTDADAIGEILVGGEDGHRVPLGRLATVRLVDAPSTITREWGRRRIVVQTNVRGRDVGSFVAEARAAIEKEVELPAGYFIRFGGQFEHLQQARTRLLVVVPVALALIFTLLFFTYGRVLDALRVFTGVPFAAVGGILALWLRDMPFSISAGVGFVALSGVSVLADMVLVSAVRQRLAQGRALRDALVDAAETRLRPVLMTALVASLGFLPMALNTGFGAEVQRPLATVVIGGVISSTMLTLLVLPVLYSIMGARAATDGDDHD